MMYINFMLISRFFIVGIKFYIKIFFFTYTERRYLAQKEHPSTQGPFLVFFKKRRIAFRMTI